MDKHIVRRDAGLTRIRKLSPADLFDSVLHVASFVHDQGTLTPELQDTRRQVLGCDAGNNLADKRRARETNQIELLLIQLNSNIDTAFNAPNKVRVQILVDHFFNDSTCRRCDF